ncbi:MAG TPA: carboxypeptidase regulatory-like domain-containing protein [Thermoanaerobaculia bacterium]|nr:carboxypeptidase regulatory-like domain-containing protein [Thermoanaerobaculia bacterium]
MNGTVRITGPGVQSQHTVQGSVTLQLTPGAFRVVATAPDCMAASQDVMVAAGKTATAVFTLLQAATLIVTVHTSAGAAIVGATVTVQRTGSPNVHDYVADDGTVRVYTVPGQFRITADAQGYVGLEGMYAAAEGEQVQAPFVLSAPATLTVTLTAAHDGSPVDGATVQALLDEFQTTATAGDAGQYTFAALQPGDYRVDVTPPGFVGVYDRVTLLEGQATTLPMALFRPASLTVQVTSGGAVVPGANVRIAIEGWSADGQTDGNGAIRFDDLMPARYRVTYAPDGRGQQVAQHDLAEGSDDTVAIAIVQRLDVTVRDESDNLLNTGHVEIGTWKKKVTKPGIAIFMLAPGTHRVNATAPGKWATYDDVTLVDERAALTIIMPRRVLIIGEGTGFGYARALAQRHPNWGITVTQYDVTDPPPGLPANIQVFRYATNVAGQTDFDLTDPACWNAVIQAYPDLFEAVLFNNPHAGFGLCKQQVYGAKLNDINGILVTPSWAYDSLASTFGNQAHLVDYAGEPPVERSVTDVYKPCCGCATRYGTVLVGGMCPKCGNAPLAATYDQRRDTLRCPYGSCNAVTPKGTSLLCSTCSRGFLVYQPKRETTGLNPYLLKCFIRHSGSALAAGGTIEINGPQWVSIYVTKEAWFDYLGIQAAATTAQFSGSPYYASYQPNLTHRTPHITWGPSVTGEANIRSMTRYYWTKQ